MPPRMTAFKGRQDKSTRVLEYLPSNLRRALSNLAQVRNWEEIRLRAGRPLGIQAGDEFLPVSADGTVGVETDRALLVQGEDLVRTISLMTGGSAYALEEDIARGFLTLPGGHRVGVTGEVLAEGGRVVRVIHPGSINIRRGRELRGIAAPVVSAIRKEGRWCHTLIVSPPGCGKTTLLRDLVRVMSDGIPAEGLRGCRVGLVDERSEVAACHRGQPLFDVGTQTDVADGCPKAEGMLMLLRSMGPDVLVTDELGRRADVSAVWEAVSAGVAVVATAHGRGPDEVLRRPYVGELLSKGAFERAVILSRRNGPGTLEGVQRLC